MRYLQISLLLIICFFAHSAWAKKAPTPPKVKSQTVRLAALPDEILGLWWSPTKDGQVEFYKKGNKYYGKVVWERSNKDENGKLKQDSHNPVANLRSRPWLGIETFKDFQYKGNNMWQDGNVYDPRSGYTYSCSLWLEGKDVLKIRGFIGISLIGKTETMTRVK